MYCIVEFTKTKEVEAVPASWVSDDGKKLWWPNFRSQEKVMNFIRKLEPVNPKTFVKYDVRILKYYSTYSTAKGHLSEAEYQSDLNSESEATPKSKRSTARAQKLFEEEFSSDEEHNGTKSIGQPHLALVIHPPPVPSSLGESNNEGVFKVPRTSIVVPSSTGQNPIPSTSARAQNTKDGGGNHCTTSNQPGNQFKDAHNGLGDVGTTSGFQSWVVRQFGIVKAQIKQVQDTLDALLQKNTEDLDGQLELNVGEESVDPMSMIPLNDYHELLDLEEKLTDARLRKKLVTFLTIQKLALGGGSNLGSVTRRMLASLMTDEFAMTLSWKGTRAEKKSFSDTKLKAVINEAVRKTKRMGGAEESEIENNIKNWLKNSKKRKLSRETKTEAEQDNSETGTCPN